MAYNIKTGTTAVITDFSAWVAAYKEQQLQHSHDQSMMTLMTPDEALLIVGPPRLTTPTASTTAAVDYTNALLSTGDFTIIGFVNTMQYQESAQVTPLKAIGSRRHIFAKTNAPVTGSISRMMVLGSNLLKTLYTETDTTNVVKSSMYGTDGAASAWFTNLEEDLFRIPFGMGIVYAAPATMDESDVYAGEYFEVCVLQSRQASMQTGQAMIMENVSFMADRVVPLTNRYGESVNPWGATATT